MKQIIALLAWIGGVGLLRAADVTRPSPDEAAIAFACLSLVMASARLLPVLREWQVARGDRRAAYETYVWLRT